MCLAARRAVLVGCLCVLAGFAQQQVTVDRLLEFINSALAQKQSDKDISAALAGMKMSQKLDTRTIEELQGRGAGPKTVAILTRLAEASASLPAPGPKVEAPKPKPLAPPSYEDQQTVLNAAREYALNYTRSLPDFICLQVTRRYVDPHFRAGQEGYWAVSDRIAEKLSYFDQHEKYETISHNENSLYGKSAETLGGALSRGDFGTMLREVFDPASSAEFHFLRWGNLENHLMYVYSYSIDQIHSKETLQFEHSQEVTPGYHGEVYIEKGSNEVWRVTVEPEPPATFPMQNIREQLDYRYTDISGQKFLLPARGEIIMRAQGVGSKNEIDFRSYRKYSAEASITFDDSDADQPAEKNDSKK